MPGASWGPWEALTGVNGVSAEALQNPDAEFFVSWNVVPIPLHGHQGPKDVSQVHPGGLGELFQG